MSTYNLNDIDTRNVHVNAYERIRNGNLEHVCEHYRSRPHHW
ncbi:hypothetical protein [Pseudescherichia vulneris]|nr:hypothetical protein [Pseudescherichia vulneris]